MSMETSENFADRLRWNDQGLIPVIAQQHDSGKVLMFAWMNRAALEASIACGEAVYWSRSRSCLWHKGESSGHVQKIIEIRTDCDQDVILLLVEQQGGIACHTGRQSCFFYRLDDGSVWSASEPVLKNPEDIYR